MCSSNASPRACDQTADAIQCVESDRFLEAMRHLASACSVVASSDGVEQAGHTVTSVCPVTTDPPRLLVCIDRSVRVHTVIVEGGTLSVNVLSDSRRDLARRFHRVGTGLSAEAYFVDGEWGRGRLGAPMLHGSLVSFDCRVAEVVPAGTHTIFICDVIDVIVNAEQNPLIVFNQDYATLAE